MLPPATRFNIPSSPAPPTRAGCGPSSPHRLPSEAAVRLVLREAERPHPSRLALPEMFHQATGLGLGAD